MDAYTLLQSPLLPIYPHAPKPIDTSSFSLSTHPPTSSKQKQNQWLGPLFYYIPMSGLAALLCGALVSAFDIMPYFESFRCSKRDFFVLIATAIVMLGVGIDKGIYCGIALSICGLLLQYSYPDVKQLGRLPGGRGGGGMAHRRPLPTG